MVNKMILQNVLHRPVRTAVSILAIAIEVAMVMLVVGLTSGMLNETARRVQGVGGDIMVQPPGSSFLLGMSSAPAPAKIANRLGELPNVLVATPVLVQSNISTSGLNLIWGIDPKTFDRVSGGFVFHSGGPLEGPNDLLVDDWYADANHVKEGQTLTLLNHEFHVAGVVEHGKGARLFIPLATAQDMSGATDRANVFFVKCVDPGYVDDAVASIKGLLPNYQVLSMPQYRSLMSSDNLPGFSKFVDAMISVAVAIGFLVIFLSMYTTITERTREIGILKSLGASKAYIIGAILREASLLCAVGIVVGYLGTVVGRRLLTASFPTLNIELTMAWATRAAVLALIGTMIGAFYPALKAARLDPVDALSYE